MKTKKDFTRMDGIINTLTSMLGMKDRHNEISEEPNSESSNTDVSSSNEQNFINLEKLSWANEQSKSCTPLDEASFRYGKTNFKFNHAKFKNSLLEKINNIPANQKQASVADIIEQNKNAHFSSDPTGKTESLKIYEFNKTDDSSSQSNEDETSCHPQDTKASLEEIGTMIANKDLDETNSSQECNSTKSEAKDNCDTLKAGDPSIVNKTRTLNIPLEDSLRYFSKNKEKGNDSVRFTKKTKNLNTPNDFQEKVNQKQHFGKVNINIAISNNHQNLPTNSISKKIKEAEGNFKDISVYGEAIGKKICAKWSGKFASSSLNEYLNQTFGSSTTNEKNLTIKDLLIFCKNNAKEEFLIDNYGRFFVICSLGRSAIASSMGMGVFYSKTPHKSMLTGHINPQCKLLLEDLEKCEKTLIEIVLTPDQKPQNPELSNINFGNVRLCKECINKVQKTNKDQEIYKNIRLYLEGITNKNTAKPKRGRKPKIST